ncbi:hypothetical protein SprV_0100251500 [Sparganum proliferum]
MTNGVKQGCVLAPTFFGLMFSAMMMDAYRANAPESASPTGRKAISSTIGRCASSRVYPQLPSQTSVSRRLRPQHHLKRRHTKEHDPLRRRVQQIRPSHQHGKDGSYAPTATQRCLRCTQTDVNGDQLQAVDKFTYLVTTLPHKTKIDDDMVHRIFKVSQAFGRQRYTVLDRHGLRISTSLKMYNAVILSKLLYEAPT